MPYFISLEQAAYDRFIRRRRLSKVRTDAYLQATLAFAQRHWLCSALTVFEQCSKSFWARLAQRLRSSPQRS